MVALDGDLGVEGVDLLGGGVDLGAADVGLGVDDLALEVGGVDDVVVDHADVPHPAAAR